MRWYGPMWLGGFLIGLRMFSTLVFSARIAAEPLELRLAELADDWPLSVGQWSSIVPVLVGSSLLFRGFGGRAETAADSTAG